jgi:hypothetical protein
MLHTEQLMLRDSDGGCLSLSFSVRIECGDRVWEELDRLCTEHVKRVGETVLFYFQSGGILLRWLPHEEGLGL